MRVPLYILTGLYFGYAGCANAPSKVDNGESLGTTVDGTPPAGGTTDGTTAKPDPARCGGSLVDTTSDPQNCRSCGHSCGGGACVASVCQPVELAGAQNNPNELAIDATSVYWTTEDGFVRKVPIVGGSSTTLASGQQFPFGIAVDATTVYWVNAVTSGQVMSVPIAGGTPTTLADHQGRPFKLVVNNGTMYWTNNGVDTVMKMPVAGGTTTLLASLQSEPVGIAIDDNTLYWSSIGQAEIRSLPLVAGGTVATIASGQSAVSLFVRNATLYWTNVRLVNDTGTVSKLPTRGGAPVALASSPGPDAAVADSSNVYWTDEISGTIMKAPLAGGAATVIATNQPSPTEIAIDDTNIYWINSFPDGAVMKLAK